MLIPYFVQPNRSKIPCKKHKHIKEVFYILFSVLSLPKLACMSHSQHISNRRAAFEECDSHTGTAASKLDNVV